MNGILKYAWTACLWFGGLGLVMLLVRLNLTGRFSFFFLLWNLFLAMIPLFLSDRLFRTFPFIQNGNRFPVYKKALWLLMLIFWMLFLPNSFYILTDLFHLGVSDLMPEWFDLVMILSFAFPSLICGISSVKIISGLLERYFNPLALIGFIFFISAAGVYIGRFLRWNSWDILHDPFYLLADCFNCFFVSPEKPEAWGFTLLFALFLVGVYLTLRSFLTFTEDGKK